jgi:hypothetical protein
MLEYVSDGLEYSKKDFKSKKLLCTTYVNYNNVSNVTIKSSYVWKKAAEKHGLLSIEMLR